MSFQDILLFNLLYFSQVAHFFFLFNKLLVSEAWIFSSAYFDATWKRFKVNDLLECDSYIVCFSACVKAIIRNLEMLKSVCCHLVRPPSHSLSLSYISLSPSFAIASPSFLPSLTVFSISSAHLSITPILAWWDGNWVPGLGFRIRWRSQSGQK